MKKIAFTQSDWDKIARKIMASTSQDPAITKAKSLLSPSLGIKFQVVTSGPPGKSNAQAYVSTGDANKDGVLDTVKIVSPVLADVFKKYHPGKIVGQIDTMEEEVLLNFLIEMANMVIHEAEGHLGGKPLEIDPSKPSGGLKDESIAQSKEIHTHSSYYDDSLHKIAKLKDAFSKEIKSVKKSPFGRR